MSEKQWCSCLCHVCESEQSSCALHESCCCELVGKPVEGGVVVAAYRWKTVHDMLQPVADEIARVGRGSGELCERGEDEPVEELVDTNCSCDCHRRGGRCGLQPCCEYAGLRSQSRGCFT